MEMKFDKVLAKYYEYWYRYCHESVIWLKETQPSKIDEIEEYKIKATKYFNFINKYWYEINFFRIGNNAFLLPYYAELKYKEYLKSQN